MASVEKVVRVSYTELENIAKSNQPKTISRAEGNAKDVTDKKKEASRQKKSRKPEQQIYRPGMSRLSKRNKENVESQSHGCENWEEEVIDVQTDSSGVGGSKENSIERDLTDKNLNTSGHSDSGKGSSRRKKRPDMQIYVPRIKLAEQEGEPYNTDERETTPASDSDAQADASQLAPNRKIQVKSNSDNFKVTVLNEQSPRLTANQSNRDSEIHKQKDAIMSRLSKISLSDQKKNTGMRRTMSSSSDQEAYAPRMKDNNFRKRDEQHGYGNYGNSNNKSSHAEVGNRAGSACSSVESSPVLGRANQNGKSSRRYSLRRRGSVSSDVSASSDLSIDDELGSRVLNWDEEVEREMARQVQEETLKIQRFLQDQSNGDMPHNHSEVNDYPDYPPPPVPSYYDNSDTSPTQEYPPQRKRYTFERSRRKDKRQTYSQPPSRDSSVHSVQSMCSESGSRNRRRGRYRRSSFDHESYDREDTVPQRLNFKVTVGKSSRKVDMPAPPLPNRMRHGSSRDSLLSDSDTGEYKNPRFNNRDDKMPEYFSGTASLDRKQLKYSRGRKNARTNNYQGRKERDRSKDSITSERGQGHTNFNRHDSSKENTTMERGGRRGGRNRNKSGDSIQTERGGHKGGRGHSDGPHDNFSTDRGGHRGGRQRKKSGDSYGKPERGGRRGGGRPGNRSYRDRSRDSEQSDDGHPRGGLLKIPSSSHRKDVSGKHSAQQDLHNVQGQDWKPQSGNRDGGNTGQRMLFDPSNPNKPIIITNSKLNFTDTGNSTSPVNTSDPYANPYGGQVLSPDRPYPATSPLGPDRPYPPPPPPAGAPGYFYGFPQMFKDRMYSDPYYSRYDVQQLIGEHTRAQCRMMAENFLRDALPLDAQLVNMLASRITGDEMLQKMMRLRMELQIRYEQVLLLDPELANKHSVEQLLWKSVFYQVIEVFRKQLNEDKDEESKQQLLKILDEGTSFYENLIQKLQRSYGFNLEAFLDTNTLPPESTSRTIKLTLLLIQKVMISLGDIARYREQAHDTANFGKARSWYMKAQHLAPKNGRPYNQLAILALYTRRKLDAVYYYMRSLAASNPFLTARESLMSLFDEARKKAESVEKRRIAEREKLRHLKQKRQRHGHRIEIWVATDGSSCENQINDNYEEDLTKIPAVELNKRFILSFLNVHGKLFTKIGMETFAEASSLMLQEFEALLQYSPPLINTSRLLQVLSINMFAIENTALKDESLEETCRSLLQEHAVELGLDMFAILTDRCADLLHQFVQSEAYPQQLFNEDLHQLFPGVKVWSDWMICHSLMWNPAPSLRHPDLGPITDLWSSLTKLCNVLKDIETSRVKIYHENQEGCDSIVLNESITLCGFIPLLSAPSETVYVHTAVDKEMARDCMRIEKLKLFSDYLCGIDPPILAYDVEKRKYYSVAPSQAIEEEIKADSFHESDSEDDVVIEDVEEELFIDEDHIKSLKQRKEELKRLKEEQDNQKKNIQEILEKSRHRCIELEIHPIFLVPDTNCFIDHLTSILKLLESKKYTVVVPIIVINELDGLAKGQNGHAGSTEHSVQVGKCAAQAVKSLEEAFEIKNQHLRAQTSKGSILETISFRSEETNSGGNNDDMILSCCLHYCQDKAREYMPKDKDAPVRLYRDVILLTDDRNLRLKAHTCNVPVKDVPSFLKWSNIT